VCEERRKEGGGERGEERGVDRAVEAEEGAA